MNLLTLTRVFLLVFVLSLRVLAQPAPDASVDTGPVAVAVTPSPTPVAAEDTADAGVLASVSGPDFTTDLAALAADPANVEVWAKLALHAVVTGQWALLVSILLTLIVAGLRKWVPETTKVGGWLRTKLGGIVSSFALALGMGFVSVLISGTPFSLAVVLKAVQVALGASGSWAIYKNVREALAEKKAIEAGAAAAAAPTSTLDK